MARFAEIYKDGFGDDWGGSGVRCGPLLFVSSHHVQGWEETDSLLIKFFTGGRLLIHVVAWSIVMFWGGCGGGRYMEWKYDY